MKFERVEDAQRLEFDSFVASAPAGDILQSWGWGEAKKATGWTPMRFRVLESGETIAACSVLLRRPAPAFPPIAYAPRGPVWKQQSALGMLIEQLTSELGDAFALVCDPCVEDVGALEASGFEVVGAGGFGGIQPKAVMVVDLHGKTPEELVSGFKSKWRYNARLATKKGVSVRVGSSDDLGAFYSLLSETAKRDGFPIRAESYYRAVWEALAPNNLRLLIAERSGNFIAAIMLGVFGDTITYLYGASSDEDRNTMPNHLLHREAITWACGEGYSTYDLQGVSPIVDGEPTDPSSAGLNRFKAGFGSRYIEYAGELDRPLRRGWYAIWRTAYPPAARLLRRLRTQD